MDRFLARLTPHQYEEWKAFYELDPWGEERADWRNAMALCCLEMLQRDDPQWKLQDFMPWSDLEEEAEPGAWAGAQSSALQAELWRTMAARFEPC